MEYVEQLLESGMTNMWMFCGKWVFITYVKGKFFGMSEFGEASKGQGLVSSS